MFHRSEITRSTVKTQYQRPSVAAILSLFGVSHMALLPVFAGEVLGDRNAFAWIVAAQGIGALVGALVTGYRDTTTLRSAGVQVLLYGLLLGSFAATASQPVALLTQVGIGFFYFSVMTSLQTLVQQVVDDAKRGRVMSLFQVCWAGLVPFGGLGLGAAADHFGVIDTLLAAAAVCVGYGAALALRSRR